MNFIRFLIIILFTYLIIVGVSNIYYNNKQKKNKILSPIKNNTNIKNTLPTTTKNKSFNTDSAKNTNDANSTDNLELPTVNNLLILIKSEYIDHINGTGDYKFNIPNLIVTNRYPSSHTTIQDKKYIKLIKKNLEKWNKIFSKFYGTNVKYLNIDDIKLVFIMETEKEFIVQALAKIIYMDRTMHLALKYYGEIINSDDIITNTNTICNIRLVSLNPISKNEFFSRISAAQKESQINFASIDQQMEYVNKINKMHIKETNIY